MLIVIIFFSSQFDSYLRSLKIDQNNICLVTDGQLPLRQCLHPEAVTKDIHLPAYYWKFSDLKKDYVKSKSQDLLCAASSNNNINNNNNSITTSTPAVTDVSKLPNLQPSASQSTSVNLAEMLNGKFISGSLWHAFAISLNSHLQFIILFSTQPDAMSLNERFSVSLEDNCWKLLNMQCYTTSTSLWLLLLLLFCRRLLG